MFITNPRSMTIYYSFFAYICISSITHAGIEPCAHSFYSDKENIETARILGRSISKELTLEYFQKLTGELPILERICIEDRCTEENKDYFRAFLIQELLNLKYQPDQIIIESKIGRISLSELYTKFKTKVDAEKPQISSFESSLPKAYLNWKHLKKVMMDNSSSFYFEFPINIYVEIEGKKKPTEIIEVNAHYDTYRMNVPGADDNGSGTVTLLNTLRLLKNVEHERTIRVVFADLEEAGLVGTKLHVDNIESKKENVLAAFVIDMFAYFPSDKNLEFVVEAKGKEISQSTTLQEINRRFVNTFMNQSNLFPRDAKAVLNIENAMPNTADHGPYWKKNYPAILIAAKYDHKHTNPENHSNRDTLKLFNWPFFYSISEQILEAVFRTAGVYNLSLEARSLHAAKEEIAFNLQSEKDWVTEEETRIKVARDNAQKEWAKMREESRKRRSYWDEYDTPSWMRSASFKEESFVSEKKSPILQPHKSESILRNEILLKDSKELLGYVYDNISANTKASDEIIYLRSTIETISKMFSAYGLNSSCFFVNQSLLNNTKFHQDKLSDFINHSVEISWISDKFFLLRIGSVVFKVDKKTNTFGFDLFSKKDLLTESLQRSVVFLGRTNTIHQELGPALLTELFDELKNAPKIEWDYLTGILVRKSVNILKIRDPLIKDFSFYESFSKFMSRPNSKKLRVFTLIRL